MVTVVTIVAVLSFLIDITDFILKLHVGSISIRFVIIALGLGYAYFRREELGDLLDTVKRSIRSSRRSFEEFDDASPLEKMKILGVLDRKKKEKKRFDKNQL